MADVSIDMEPTLQYMSEWGRPTRKLQLRSAGDMVCRDLWFNNLYVALDGHHNRILVSDEDNKCIHTCDLDGRKIGKLWSSEQFSTPRGLCMDNCGNVLVADYYNKDVAWYSSDGRFIEQVVKTGATPCGIAMDKNGNFVVTDDTPGSLTFYR